jgi:hypothetical protein
MGYLVCERKAPVTPSNLKIDIVIPAVDKDLVTLPYVIDFARTNVLHPISQIYVISPVSEKIQRICSDKGCEFVQEDSLLPIKKSDINYRIGSLDRAGWMYQQFLKLSGDHICSQNNYLVLDSDTLLIRPQVFERSGKYIFNFSDEYHKPYFAAYQRLLGHPVTCPVSFTSHHILVDVNVLLQLKQELAERAGLPWYEAIMNAIDKSEPSGHSDYDTYGQYALEKLRGAVLLDYWYNVSVPRQLVNGANQLARRFSKRYKSMSFHSYNDLPPEIRTS